MTQYEARGKDWSDKADPLWEESAFYMQGWQELRTCAPVAYGFAPVPWTAIYSYLAAHDDLEDLERFVRMIWALDSRMGAIETEKRKQEEKRGNKNHQDSAGRFGHPGGGSPGTR